MRPPVILGGGPAGSAAALALRRAGQHAIVLERSAHMADKLCGDFLGVSAIRAIEAYGIDVAALGGQPLATLRIVRRERARETALPFRAAGLSRRVLDEALLGRAELAGAVVLRGVPARAPRQEGLDLIVAARGRAPMETGTVFLATGSIDPEGRPRASDGPRLLALKATFKLRPEQTNALRGHAELVSLPGGHAALHLVGGELATLCALARIDPDGGDVDDDAELETLLARAPHLARRLDGAARLGPALRALAPARGHVHRHGVEDHDGLYMLGDRAVSMPSATADGVSIAIRSAERAVRAWLAGAGAGAYHRSLRGMLWPRASLAAELRAGGPEPGIAAGWIESRI